MHAFYPRLLALCLLLCPMLAHAAEPAGASLSLLWALPFAGMLLSIAVCPLVLPHIWHDHFGKIAAFWVAAFLIPFSIGFGLDAALHNVVHALIGEYIPFILLLFALYTISGGILLWGTLPGSAKVNTSLLALGTALASIMGTTGAAMLFIRPILKANAHRQHNVHVVIFFIFLVANIGGGLTPLGDPPLFLGFLQSVRFMWTVQHMLPSVLFCAVVLLTLFYFLDRHYWRLDPAPQAHEKPQPVKIYGLGNLVLIAGGRWCRADVRRVA